MTPSETHGPVARPEPVSRPEAPRSARAAADLAVTVNGATRTVPAGASVAELLRALALDPRTVVVEHNGEILRDRGSLDGHGLRAGDVLEVVHFVGGG